MSTIQGK